MYRQINVTNLFSQVMNKINEKTRVHCHAFYVFTIVVALPPVKGNVGQLKKIITNECIILSSSNAKEKGG